MVAEKVPMAALAAGVRSSIGERCLGWSSGGNGKSSPGVNSGCVGPPPGGVGAGVGPPPGGVGAGVGPPPGGVGAGVGPPPGGGVGSGLPGGVVSGGVMSSPRTRYQFLTGVALEPSP